MMAMVETRMTAMEEEKTVTREEDMEINYLATRIMAMWMKVLDIQGFKSIIHQTKDLFKRGIF